MAGGGDLGTAKGKIEIEFDAGGAQDALDFLDKLGDAGNSISSSLGGGLGKASSAFGEMGSSAGGAIASFLEFGRSLGGTMYALKTAGDVVADVVGNFFDVNSTAESAAFAFTHFEGSASAATKTLGNLQSFSETTPFSFPQIRDTALQMERFGTATTDVIPDLKAVGDAVVANFGKPNIEAVDSIVNALGRVQEQGTLTSRSLFTLSQSGIDAEKMMAVGLGTTVPDAMEQLQTHSITIQQAVQAIYRGMEMTYGGNMTRYMSTMPAELSQIQTGAEKMWLAFSGPAYTAAEKALGYLINMFSGDTGAGFMKIASGAGAVLGNIVQAAGVVIGAVGTVAGGIGNIGGTFLNFIGGPPPTAPGGITKTLADMAAVPGAMPTYNDYKQMYQQYLSEPLSQATQDFISGAAQEVQQGIYTTSGVKAAFTYQMAAPSTAGMPMSYGYYDPSTGMTYYGPPQAPSAFDQAAGRTAPTGIYDPSTGARYGGGGPSWDFGQWFSGIMQGIFSGPSSMQNWQATQGIGGGGGMAFLPDNLNQMVATTQAAYDKLPPIAKAGLSAMGDIVTGQFQNLPQDIAPVLTAGLAQLPQITLPDIGGMISSAIGSISLPSLPDIGGMISSALSGAIGSISLPSLPDIGGMISSALGGVFGGISLPSLPDIGGMISSALSSLGGISLPSLPDIGGMINSALGGIFGGIQIPSFNFPGPQVNVSDPTPSFFSFPGPFINVGAPTWLFSGLGMLQHGEEHVRGGMYLTGEEGPELVALPQGASVYSHSRSMNMLRGAGGGSLAGIGGGPITIQVILDSQVLAEASLPHLLSSIALRVGRR